MATQGRTQPAGYAPNYWMYETSGDLAAAVHQYQNNPNACTLRQLALLRAYFQQWVDAQVWDRNPAIDDESRADLARLRLQCRGITNVADMEAWLQRATELGMDPL